MSTTTATTPHAAAQAEFRASAEYQAEVAGFAERTRLGLVGTAATEFVSEACEAADAARARIDAKHGIGAPQPATTRTEPSLQGLLALAHRCARLNPKAGAIGAGMLATIVEEARAALGWKESIAAPVSAALPPAPMAERDTGLRGAKGSIFQRYDEVVPATVLYHRRGSKPHHDELLVRHDGVSPDHRFTENLVGREQRFRRHRNNQWVAVQPDACPYLGHKHTPHFVLGAQTFQQPWPF